MKRILQIILAVNIMFFSTAAFAAGSHHEGESSAQSAQASQKKLTLKERIAVSILKKKLSKTSEGQELLSKAKAEKKSEFDAVGFLLGLLLGLLGVLIAYILKGAGTLGEDAPKSAWLGLLVWILIFILLVAVVFSAASSTVTTL